MGRKFALKSFFSLKFDFKMGFSCKNWLQKSYSIFQLDFKTSFSFKNRFQKISGTKTSFYGSLWPKYLLHKTFFGWNLTLKEVLTIEIASKSDVSSQNQVSKLFSGLKTNLRKFSAWKLSCMVHSGPEFCFTNSFLSEFRLPKEFGYRNRPQNCVKLVFFAPKQFLPLENRLQK